MIRRTVVLLLLLGGGLAAQSGTTPKQTELDYPAHFKLEKLSIGAEYLMHSFSGSGETYIAKDYLVLEVALFPVKGESTTVNAGQFTLRVNGRKPPLAPQGAAMVAESLKHPEQSSGPHTVVGLGPVILGAPQPTGRFPGDPTAGAPLPPPRAPDDNPSGQEKQSGVTAEDLAVQAALPEGEHRGPASGYLYFPYRGSLKRIRSLELEYTGPAGKASLPLPLL